MVVKSKDTHNVNEIDNVCIVINNEDPDQHHTGFFFKNTKDEVKFLHLAWFDHLLYEDPDEKYFWLDIPIDKFNLMQMQMFLENIHNKNNQECSYGVALDGVSFNNDGNLLQENLHSGLTCATFVMRALEAQGYNLINLDTWEIRKEDKIWQEKIIGALQNYWKTTPAFIEFQKNYIGKVARYKPIEVVAAANSEEIPLNQDKVIELSKKLLKIIQ